MANFKISNFIAEDSGAFISANIKDLKSAANNIYIVQSEHVRRLDLISYYLFRTVDLKWLLIYVNGIKDIDEIVEGQSLKYPSISDVIKYMMRSMEARNSV